MKMCDVRCGMLDGRCQMLDGKHKLSSVSCQLTSVIFCRIWHKLSTTKNQQSKIVILVSCFLFFVSFPVFSQSASASLDRDKIVLGEQVTLELKADNINLQTSPLIKWFLLRDTGNHIEVVKRSPIDTLAVNGTLSYTQNITITSFDSGNWKLPLLQIIVQRDGTKKDTLKANELALQVLPVDVSNLQQYHPMKDIIDVEVKPDYSFIFYTIALVILLAVILWFFLRKKKKPAVKFVPAQSIFETAIRQLEMLEADNPPTGVFYARLDDICRYFIQHQSGIHALQLTSDELMVQLNAHLPGEARTQFYQLLRLISAVKFAKYQPDELQKSAAIITAKETVHHIYHHTQRSLLQHAK